MILGIPTSIWSSFWFSDSLTVSVCWITLLFTWPYLWDHPIDFPKQHTKLSFVLPLPYKQENHQNPLIYLPTLRKHRWQNMNENRHLQADAAPIQHLGKAIGLLRSLHIVNYKNRDVFLRIERRMEFNSLINLYDWLICVEIMKSLKVFAISLLNDSH